MKNIAGKIKNYFKAYRQPVEFDLLNRFNFFPISKEPVIIFTYIGWNLSNVAWMASQLKVDKVTFLVGFSRYINTWKARHLKKQIVQLGKMYPGLEIVFLVNSEEEKSIFNSLEIESYFVPNNCHQREDIFEVIPGLDKKYNAVMNARMARWKRIELGNKIDNIALITIQDDEKYLREMRELFRSSYWPNYERDNKYSYLSRDKINTILNESYVGLIFSEIEGNNRATIEYLMSGIPVVSTKSKGGRDYFITPECGRIVEANENAIVTAVEELKSLEFDPFQIRKLTMDKIFKHRNVFIQIVEKVSNGSVKIELSSWLDKFPSNMEFRCNAENFMLFYKSDYFDTLPPATSEAYLKKNYYTIWEKILVD